MNAATVPIATLHQFPGNPRRGDVEAIARSLQRLGQYRPIVVRRATMEVLAGNHTLQAAERLGWTDIDVAFVDVDEQHARAIVAADNRLADLGSYDDEDLATLLRSIDDEDLRDAAGYDDEDLAALLASIEEDRAVPSDADDAPPLPATPVSAPGDVWTLGRHRLACSPAQDPVVWERMLAGRQVACMWTDPPYGVSYVGKTADALTIAGDDLDEVALAALLDEAFGTVDAFMQPGARAYVAHPPGALHMPFLAAVAKFWRVHETLVWVKDSMVLGHADYHYKHEPIVLAYKPGDGRWGRGGKGWYGDNSQVSVFEVPRPKRSEEHPTMKPVELVVRMLRNSVAPGSVVADPFCGSGTTLLAAEVVGADCMATEIDPAYCDVIVQRWETVTGQRAARHEVGTSVP